MQSYDARTQAYKWATTENEDQSLLFQRRLKLEKSLEFSPSKRSHAVDNPIPHQLELASAFGNWIELRPYESLNRKLPNNRGRAVLVDVQATEMKQ
jgi:hypothetical protein